MYRVKLVGAADAVEMLSIVACSGSRSGVEAATVDVSGLVLDLRRSDNSSTVLDQYSLSVPGPILLTCLQVILQISNARTFVLPVRSK